MRAMAMVAVEAGLEILRALNGRVDIDCLVTTREFHARFEPEFYRQRTLVVNDYSLRDADDRARFKGESVDVVLVLGWQRLLPKWLLQFSSIGTIGVHGSAYGITAGRGRSPQNWAILLGEPSFDVCLFWLTPEVDDGSVIRCHTFPYSDRDDIVSSQLKVAYVCANMLVDVWGELDRTTGVAQGGTAYYLPRRLPEDGVIDWYLDTNSIDRLVRAVTHPYGGARSLLPTGSPLHIWRGRPISYGVAVPGPPGTIVQVGSRGCFCVATGDGAFLVDEWTSHDSFVPAVSVTLQSQDIVETNALLMKRHLTANPNQLVAPQVRAFLNQSRKSRHGRDDVIDQ